MNGVIATHIHAHAKNSQGYKRMIDKAKIYG